MGRKHSLCTKVRLQYITYLQMHLRRHREVARPAEKVLGEIHQHRRRSTQLGIFLRVGHCRNVGDLASVQQRRDLKRRTASLACAVRNEWQADELELALLVKVPMYIMHHDARMVHVITRAWPTAARFGSC